MFGLFKADIYRLLYKKNNIFIFVISEIICALIAIIKTKQTGNISLLELCYSSFEWALFPVIISIFALIYYVLYDYFENDFVSCEKVMGYTMTQIICSKTSTITVIFGMVFAGLPIVLIFVFESCYHRCIYDDLLIRSISLFLIIMRLCVDAIALNYIVHNFFIYMVSACTIWMVIPDFLKKNQIQNIRIYVFSWKYQMSLIASAGVTKGMLFKYVIPYECIVFLIHLLLMSGILYIWIKENR